MTALWPVSLKSVENPISVMETFRKGLDAAPYPITGEVVQSGNVILMLAVCPLDNQLLAFSIEGDDFGRWPVTISYENRKADSAKDSTELTAKLKAYTHSDEGISLLSSLCSKAV